LPNILNLNFLLRYNIFFYNIFLRQRNHLIMT
jgi:hypothetical protein